MVTGIILFTLAYDYTINANVLALRETSPFLVFLQAFTTRIVKGERLTSLGIFWLTFFVWLVGMAVALADIGRSRAERLKARWLGLGALIFTAISGGIFLVFGLVHAAASPAIPAAKAPAQRSRSTILPAWCRATLCPTMW